MICNFQKDTKRQQLDRHKEFVCKMIDLKPNYRFVDILDIANRNIPFCDLIVSCKVNNNNVKIYTECKTDYVKSGNLVSEIFSFVKYSELNRKFFNTGKAIYKGSKEYDYLWNYVKNNVNNKDNKRGIGFLKNGSIINQNNKRHVFAYYLTKQNKVMYLKTCHFAEYSKKCFKEQYPIYVTESKKNNKKWYTVGLLLKREEVEQNNKMIFGILYL